MKKPTRDPSTGVDGSGDHDTGLPWPTSWRGVYVLVVGIFATWVVLLAAFMRAFA